MRIRLDKIKNFYLHFKTNLRIFNFYTVGCLTVKYVRSDHGNFNQNGTLLLNLYLCSSSNELKNKTNFKRMYCVFK